jgi:hypothetical protein
LASKLKKVQTKSAALRKQNIILTRDFQNWFDTFIFSFLKKERSRERRRVRAWATRGRRGRRRTSNGSRQRSRQVNRIEYNRI